jgi:hypothetical protein
VLALELTDTGQILLFPGDAQVGNWLSWDKYSWEIDGGRRGQKTVTAQDLLARTVFYKVGHHGSHNATLREKGLPDLVAMIPVNKDMAKKKRWNMPLPALRTRLTEKCKCVIVQDEAELSAAALPGQVHAESLYVDYFL